jgi:hypothetical protein
MGVMLAHKVQARCEHESHATHVHHLPEVKDFEEVAVEKVREQKSCSHLEHELQD